MIETTLFLKTIIILAAQLGLSLATCFYCLKSARKAYENNGWRQSYQGKAFYLHPWFSWSKKERWINDRSAINYWMNHRGGSEGQLDAIKKSYPEDFTTKTY